MTPERFWDATVREVLLMIKAYDLRELNKTRLIRLLRYDTYCLNIEKEKRISIYEYMPLEGDPTEEELLEMEQEEDRDLQREYEMAKEFYRQNGIEF